MRTMRCPHRYVGTSIRIATGIPDGRIRAIYGDMVRRCYSERSQDFRYYGARGIQICDEWLDGGAAFYDWYIHQDGWDKGLTIDRIDPDSGYSPSNCRLISREENARWKRGTNRFSVHNITLSGRQWASALQLGTNFVNDYCRANGQRATEAMLHRRLFAELERVANIES